MFICDHCLDRDYPTARKAAGLNPATAFMSHGECEKCGEVRDCYDPPVFFLGRHRGPKIRARVAHRNARALRERVEALAIDHEADLACLPDGLAREVRSIANEYDRLSAELHDIATKVQEGA